MDNRRFTLFLVLSTLILFLSYGEPVPPPNEQDGNADQKAASDDPENSSGEADGAETPPETVSEDATEQVEEKPDELVKLPDPEGIPEIVQLGSTDAETGYFMKVDITARSGSVESLKLSDPRYRKLDAVDEPLALLEPRVDRESRKPLHSFSTSFTPLDALRQAGGRNQSGASNWSVIEKTEDPDQPGLFSAVTLGLQSPEGDIEVRKTYRVNRMTGTPAELLAARDGNSAGYQLVLEIEIINRGQQAFEAGYELQGPVGTLLENAENTRKFRDFTIGVFEDDGDFDSHIMTASDVVESIDEDAREEWSAALRYVGIDNQFFTVLMVPRDYQMEFPYTASIHPDLVQKDSEDPIRSRISLHLASRTFDLEPGKTLRHTYQIYAGPKRQVLLSGLSQFAPGDSEGEERVVPIEAEESLAYGFFGTVAKLMLWMLNLLHAGGIPYGFAIVCLTIMVRGCMFPLSRKQAIGAQKMKELQPKINELKKKYAKDKEKFARAQMELMSKHNYNPLAGCLPMIFQLPIFLGLYTALNSSIDLRMAPFFYISNLAAPDAIIPDAFGVSLPLLGKDLNLLPLITIVLFVAQQKLFMPPPADAQQAQQYKFMNIMMIVFGVMFYRVPAGLCVYFIASSLWGIGERKLLDIQNKKSGPVLVENPSETQGSTPKKSSRNPRNGSGSRGRSRRKR